MIYFSTIFTNSFENKSAKISKCIFLSTEGQQTLLNVKIIIISSYIITPSVQSPQISKRLHESGSTDVLYLVLSLDTLHVVEPASTNGHLSRQRSVNQRLTNGVYKTHL